MGNDDDLGYDCPDQDTGYAKCMGCKKWLPADELHDGIDCDKCFNQLPEETEFLPSDS